jgi:tetratricopeptide (TPR) repeat protein
MIAEMDAELLDRARAVDPVVLGQRVRAARLARNMTQTAVAGSEMSTAYVSRIEAGQRRPDPELIAVIAQRVGVDVETLVTGTSRDVLAEQRLALDWAELALRTGDAESALGQVEDVLAQEPGAEIRRTALHLKAGALERQPERLDEAIMVLEDLTADPVGDTAWLADMQALCRCYRTSDDLTRSIEVGERALARLDELGLDGGDGAVGLTMSLVAAYFERGDTGHARRLVHRAVARAEAYGSPESLAKTYWNASIIESRNGRTAAAIPLARKALALLEASDDARALGHLRTQLGLMELRVDAPDAALALSELRTAEAQLRTSHATANDLATNHLHQARAHYMLGDTAEARAAAESVCRDGSALLTAEAFVIIGLVELSQGHRDEAAQAYRTAVLHLTALGSDRGAAQLWFELGDLLEMIGDTDGALDAFRRAGASTGLRSTESSIVATRDVRVDAR